MNQYKVISMLLGIGTMLLFLALFLESKNPINLFYMTIGLIVFILGYFTKDKNINLTFSLFIALIGVNIIQLIILLYIYYYNPVYLKTGFYEYLVILAILILTLININHKNKLNAPKAGEKTKNKLLEDKTKLILLLTGIIIIIGFLGAFIIYNGPTFLYIATFGLLAFIYGYYHENGKINVSTNYVRAMVSVFILQYVIFGFTHHQFSKDDFRVVSFSFLINFYFFLKTPNDALFKALLPYNREKKIISNAKLKQIIGIGGIVLFIAIIGFYSMGAGSQVGHAPTNITGNITMSDYSTIDTSYNTNSNVPTNTFSKLGINFNYPYDPMNDINWYLTPDGTNGIIVSKNNGYETHFTVEIISNNGTSEENIIKKYQESITPGWEKIANYKIIIDNKTAYEDVYTSKENRYNTFMKITRILLIKNDKTYFMILQAPESDFDNEKPNFAIILNSFKVD